MKEIRGAIAEFAGGRKLRASADYMGFDSTRGETPETPEPRSQIELMLRALKDDESQPGQARLLKAIANDLDGGLRDIRALKMDIQGIAESGDLRAEFRGRKR